jgi:hypothetical protein
MEWNSAVIQPLFKNMIPSILAETNLLRRDYVQSVQEKANVSRCKERDPQHAVGRCPNSSMGKGNNRRDSLVIVRRGAGTHRQKAKLPCGDRALSKDHRDARARVPPLFAGMAFPAQVEGQPPPESDPKVYGVLVDVHLENGTEFVAAYADHSARYFNYTGGGIIWEAPDSSLNDKIDTLLQACEAVTRQLPPLTLEQGRPIPPKNVDTVQINILTPGGIRHGIGTFEQLSQNTSANAIIAGATDLMKNLVDKNLKK